MKESVRSLYPSTKLWMILFFIVSSLVTSGYIYQIVIVALVLLLSLICGELKGVVISLIKGLTLLFVFAFIMQAILIEQEGSKIIFEFYFIKINDLGLYAAFKFCLKILVMSSSILWYFKTTQIKDIAYAIEASGTSKKVSFVIMSVFQIIDQLKEKSKTIMQAQMSRGIETQGNIIVRIKSIIPIIIPLILSTLESSDERVLTLEARAFSSTNKKTNIYTVSMTSRDKVLKLLFIILLIVYIGLVIALNIGGIL